MKDSYLERVMTTSKIDSLQEYQKWAQEIPFMRFPADWEIKIIPPFCGAIVRFVIRRINEEKSISVYLDCYGTLGSLGDPYWEIHPYNGDTYKCYLNETGNLIDAIDYALGNKESILTKSKHDNIKGVFTFC